MKSLNFAIATLFSGILATSLYILDSKVYAQSPSRCPSSRSGLLSWEELPTKLGENTRYYDLPKPFKNGLIWFDYGADNGQLYVFPVNSCPPISKERNRDRAINAAVIDKYIKNGQVLMFFYGGKNGENNNIRRNGNWTCLRSTCLVADSLSEEQIIKILRSERRNK